MSAAKSVRVLNQSDRSEHAGKVVLKKGITDVAADVWAEAQKRPAIAAMLAAGTLLLVA